MTTRLRTLTQRQLDEFDRDGYLIVPDVYGAAEMDAALAACDLATYGMPYVEWRAKIDGGAEARQIADGISRKDNVGRPQFPTGVPALDRLIENQTLLDIFCDLLDTDDLHYINGHLFVRAGPTDKRYSEHPWEGFHFDHETGSFLPPWNAPLTFDYLGCGVVLHDIDEHCAPSILIPGSHKTLQGLMPRLVREGALILPTTFPDIRRVPEFSARSLFTARRGSIGISSTYLVHAAQPFADKRQQRAAWTLSLGRAANMGFDRFSNAYHNSERPFTVPFWTGASERVRSLFGWPRPGHPYYTAETLELLALQYPGMDLSPYAARVAGPMARPGRLTGVA